MSGIPKSKRRPSRLEALHIMYRVRKQLTLEILNSFDLTEQQQLKHINAMIKDLPKEDKENTRIFLYKVEDDPNLWLFEEERKSLLNFCRNIISNMAMAEAIHISNEEDYLQRRRCWNLAIGNTEALIQELQYLVQVLPKDINRLTNLALDLDKVLNLLRGLRAYDNKLLQG